MNLRSQLYLPGDRLDRLPRALSSGADGVILDLEDGVAPAAKDRARESLASLTRDALGSDVAISVRIDPLSMEPDVDAALECGSGRIVLAKAEAESIGRLDAVLRARPDTDEVAVVALVESARGLLDALHLAEHHRVVGLALGEADLRADLGVTPGPDDLEMLPARSAIVTVSAAAGLASPVAPVWTAIDDREGFRRSCERLRRLGFGSRSAIHPSQVETINEIFAPSDAELAEARAVVDAFDVALAEGRGVARGPDGSMIDEAVVRTARRTLGT